MRVRGAGGGRVSIAGVACYRLGGRPHLYYTLRVHRRRKGEPKGFTWADYRDLISSRTGSSARRCCGAGITSTSISRRSWRTSSQRTRRASWAADISGKGQLSFRRQHQPWFRSVSSPARAGRLVRPRVSARRAEGGRAGKNRTVVALALAALLAGGASGKLGIDSLHVCQDRHVRGGARG